MVVLVTHQAQQNLTSLGFYRQVESLTSRQWIAGSDVTPAPLQFLPNMESFFKTRQMETCTAL